MTKGGSYRGIEIISKCIEQVSRDCFTVGMFPQRVSKRLFTQIDLQEISEHKREMLSWWLCNPFVPNYKIDQPDH